MNAIYENILRLCQKRGITGAKMCRDIGIGKSLMSSLKSGRTSSINAATAQKIAAYFGVPVGMITGDPMSLNDMMYMVAVDAGLDKAAAVLDPNKKAPTPEGGRELPHAVQREILAGKGIRLMLDADAKLTEAQLEDIINFIEFQQEKNGR